MTYQTIEGHFSAEGLKVAIVVGRFNDFITGRLLEGAIDAFARHKGNVADLTVAKVPGAYEIPLTCQKLARTKKYDAIVTLGAVIRGSTPHFDFVSNEVSKGVASVSLDNDIPVGFGVLTTDNIEQAIERAGSKAGNKGAEAMLTVIEQVDLHRQIS